MRLLETGLRVDFLTPAHLHPDLFDQWQSWRPRWRSLVDRPRGPPTNELNTGLSTWTEFIYTEFFVYLMLRSACVPTLLELQLVRSSSVTAGK